MSPKASRAAVACAYCGVKLPEEHVRKLRASGPELWIACANTTCPASAHGVARSDGHVDILFLARPR